jgi:hypothetical protein
MAFPDAWVEMNIAEEPEIAENDSTLTSDG